jgi:hypothetical protein
MIIKDLKINSNVEADDLTGTLVQWEIFRISHSNFPSGVSKLDFIKSLLCIPHPTQEDPSYK